MTNRKYIIVFSSDIEDQKKRGKMESEIVEMANSIDSLSSGDVLKPTGWSGYQGAIANRIITGDITEHLYIYITNSPS